MDIAETKLAQMSTSGQIPLPKTVDELLDLAKEIHKNLNFVENDVLRLAVILSHFGLEKEALQIKD